MWAIDSPRIAVLCGCLAAAGSSAAWAQAVSDTDIEHARQSQPTITDADVARAQKRHRMPSDAELQRTPAPAAPRIEALPQPAASAMDLGALAGGFDASSTQPGIADAGPKLLVFISFSMPDAALSRLVDQAAKAGAALELRGLSEGSVVRTVARVQQLIGSRRVAVQIDPQAFDRYGVTQAPAFVLVRGGVQPAPCAAGLCLPGDAYALAAGDVSLDYALSFLRRSAPRFARDADGFLKRLRPSN